MEPTPTMDEFLNGTIGIPCDISDLLPQPLAEGGSVLYQLLSILIDEPLGFRITQSIGL